MHNRNQPDPPLCECGHQLASHAPVSSGDTRCVIVEHPGDLLQVFDDVRGHDELAYCACLRYAAARAPRVLNKRVDGVPAGAVYVGRPSKWGNPYVIGHDGPRERVIERYREHLNHSGLIEQLSELTGRDLVCWCTPAACHADVLLELANPR